MDIEGLGDKLVNQLVDEGLVTGYGDLYRLDVESVARLPRMGQRSAEKLVAAIQSSKTRGLARVLNALSIRHVGSTVARVLARNFGSVQRMASASVEELAAVDEVGEIIADSVFRFFASETGRQVIADLTGQGVVMTDDAADSPADSQVLAGKTLVVTGTLQNRTRDEMHALIGRHGGKTSSSVSSKTDYLVAGEKPGSKLTKAEKLGVPVLTEQQLEQMLGIGTDS